MVKNEIKVFARLKPEAKKKNSVNYQIYRRPQKHIEEDYLVLNGAQKSINEYINNRPESWKFAFHKIFNDSVHQREVFENVAQPVIQSVLNGYNATIFAYGQTGSGKTFSITGEPERYEDRGVLPRTIQYLFETIKKNPDNLYSVEIAYLEIYNENGYDLLDPKHEVVTKLEDLPRVTIQEDETGTLHLKNLSFRTVENEKDALALLFLGDTNRAISETPMNPQSSRSHCIFTIVVSVKQSGAQHLRKAKMHLVDLAGSERVYKCCISGSILTEAKHINLSLHYLEQVIVCLGQQNVSHIPYRNSLLTAILRDSLGGNCLTTMLATLSLNVSNLEETISTCRFSQRVALIKNDVNLVLESNPVDEIRFLKMEIERLKNELAQLTKRPVTSEELTEKEKQDLNFQVNKFLESDETIIDWQKDDRKIRYCLQVLRQNFKIRNGENIGLEETEKDLNYYRNLVIQRDKEISALINMLKKSGKNTSNDSADSTGFSETNKTRNETIPKISTIAKHLRLKDVMVEARSIAELIKIGKASIGDLRIRITYTENPIEIRNLEENLQTEQSRLARNLSLLKNLKSEATRLKAAILMEETEYPGNFIAESTRRSVNGSEKSFAPRTPANEKKSNVGVNDSGNVLMVSRQTPTSLKLSPKHDCHESRKSGESNDCLNQKNAFNKLDEKNENDIYRVNCVSSSRKSHSFGTPSPARRIIELNVESDALKSQESKTVDLLKPFNAREQKSSGDNLGVDCVSSSSKSHYLGAPSAARRIIELNIESDASKSQESNTVDLSKPFNAGDQKKADDDLAVDCFPSSGNDHLSGVPSTVSKIVELNVESVSPRSRESKAVNLRKPFDAGDSERNSPVGESFLKTKTSSSRESRRPRFRAPAFLRDMLRSDVDSGPGTKSLSTEKNDDPTHVVAEQSEETSATSEPNNITRSSMNSSCIDLSNDLRGQETPVSNGNDCGHKPSSKQSGKFCGGWIVAEKEESTKSVGEMEEPILVTAENLELNTIAKDHSTISEEDSFIRSLPLTGDHEIDEEIIAFYRAKRSGGLY